MLNLDARLSDSQSAFHHLDMFAGLSAVTFLLFPSRLFCTLVIVFLYKNPRRVISASEA